MERGPQRLTTTLEHYYYGTSYEYYAIGSRRSQDRPQTPFTLPPCRVKAS